MLAIDDVTNEVIEERNSSWSKFTDYSYIILVIGGSRSGKTNLLFSITSHQSDVDKIYLYAKDP